MRYYDETIENLWNKILREHIDKPKEYKKMQKRYKHCFEVRDLAMLIYKNCYTEKKEEKEKALYISACLHDICKLKKKHGKAAAKYLKENLYGIDRELKEKVINIVRYHSTKNYKKKEKDNLELITIIRVADKCSKEKDYDFEKISNLDIVKSNIHLQELIQKIKVFMKESS